MANLSRPRNRAATLCALALGVAGALGCERNEVKPEDAARQWADKLKLPVRGTACTMFDSDGDGYVSCVLALDGPDKVYFQGLQCGEFHSTKGGGCKPDQKNPEVHLVMEITSKPTVSAAPPPTTKIPE
jgi:hypothetical protein